MLFILYKNFMYSIRTKVWTDYLQVDKLLDLEINISDAINNWML